MTKNSHPKFWIEIHLPEFFAGSQHTNHFIIYADTIMVFCSSFCVCKGFAFSEDMISQGGLKIRCARRALVTTSLTVFPPCLQTTILRVLPPS